MKKIAIMLAFLALCLPSLAMADGIELEGSIEASRVRTILAPYSGVAGDVDVRAGDELAAEAALLSLSTTAVYADFDGVVTGVFAQAGDAAASVQERYGALLYLERSALYRADCSTTGAGSGNENKIVHVGERVYLRSTQNEKRQGEGIVTSVQGSLYTLEITDPDSLNYNDHVRVYRDARYNSNDCIGAGALSRIDPTPVTGEGHVLAVHVQDGQKVSRGDLLLELVPDALADMRGGDAAVRMPEDGVALEVLVRGGEQVAKDAPLLTYCPAGAIELVCAADEDDLTELAVGDEMTVTLDAYPNETLRGTVTKISGVGESDGGRMRFDVTVAVQDGGLARIGMSATAKK